MPVDLEKSVVAQLTLWAFRGIVAVCLLVIGFFSQQLYYKADNAEPRAEYLQQTKAQWDAIGKITLAAQVLSETVATLSARFNDHIEASKNITSQEQDHEARIRALERTRSNQ